MEIQKFIDQWTTHRGIIDWRDDFIKGLNEVIESEIKNRIPSDQEIEKHYEKMWEQKPLGTVTHFGFVAGAKYLRDTITTKNNTK